MQVEHRWNDDISLVKTASVQYRGIAIGAVCIAAGILLGHTPTSGEGFPENEPSFSQTERGFDTVRTDEPSLDKQGIYTESTLNSWTRPEGPLRVGIQAGHWRVEEVPNELKNLKQNGAGAVIVGANERDIVLPIARRVVALLQSAGIDAELLPVTVPPGYVADAFVSLHADSNGNPNATGYKAAAPQIDRSQKSEALTAALNDAYGAATNLAHDSAITWHMTGYYSFNWQRFKHAIHPMTPASIMELGYLTNAHDRRLMREEPDRVAEGIARGIRMFLDAENKQASNLH